MKKILLIASILVLVPIISFAEKEALEFSLAASSKTIESQLALKMEITNGQILSAGGGLTVIDNDERIINAGAIIMGEDFRPGFQYGVGLKWHGSDRIGHDEDKNFDMNSVGLNFALRYDMLADPEYKAPVILWAEFTGAPASLCFGDARSYIDLIIRGSIYVLPNALFFLQFNYYKIKFDDSADGTFKFRDTDLFVGVSFQF
jgi:hypothetical protein